MVAIGCNWKPIFEVQNGLKFLILKRLVLGDAGPEKAGVGGSIPSLATLFSTAYKHSSHAVCSILFQFQIQACRDCLIRTRCYERLDSNGTSTEQPSIHDRRSYRERSVFPSFS